MATLLKRCKDKYTEGRGIVIPLVDADLIKMLKLVGELVASPYERLMTERFGQVATGGR
jgi:hypothetical protein